MRVILIVAVLVTALSAPVAGKVQLPSPSCRTVIGESQTDAERALEFRRPMPAGAVTSVSVYDTLVWVNVTEAIAREILADRLNGERLVLIWMRLWRKTSSQSHFKIFVEWEGVNIAEGYVTWLGEDRVEFSR